MLLARIAPYLVSLSGLLSLCLLVWIAGPQIKLPGAHPTLLAGELTRAGLVASLVVLWAVNQLRLHWVARRSCRALLAGFCTSAEQRAAAQEDSELRLRFERAVGVLKGYKFMGAKALYRLPWYVIIGSPGAGKTTALINSGLHFPLAKTTRPRALQGIAGTRYCDWWFTNEAVLIDTAGRYTTQDSHEALDKAAWFGFLSLLRRYRPKRPINGAIVAVSLQDLLTQNEQERQQQALVARERIEELVDHLGLRLPIYIVLTKTDLVSGFNEYFAAFDKPAREQVWGVSLPKGSAYNQASALQLLRRQLDQLTQGLYTRLFARLHQERDARRRAKIAGFPQQFESAQKLALEFVEQVFAPNHFRSQPILRGVYFTSALQDAMAVDRLASAVAKSFGFSRETVRMSETSGKSYFLTQLFTQVIFPEADLAGGESRYERSARWLRNASVTLLMVGALGLSVQWTRELTSHGFYLNQVSEKVAQSASVNAAQLSRRLAGLDALLAASQIESGAAGLTLGDRTIQTAAESAYRHQLQSLLLPELMKSLENSLNAQAPEHLYEPLRIYLMLGNLKHFDGESVQRWFNERGALGQELLPSLRLHLSNLLALPLAPQPIKADLVSKARATLLAEPVAERAYKRLKAHPLYGRRVSLPEQSLGERERVFSIEEHEQAGLQLPLMFTQEGSKLMDFSANSALLAELLEESWVLNHAANPSREVAEQVRDLYLSDYARFWANFYGRWQLLEFQTLAEGAAVLAALADPEDSPLLALLRTVQRNTEPLTIAHGSGTRRYDALASQLSDLKSFALDQSRLAALMDHLQLMHRQIVSLADSPQGSAAVFDAVRARFSGRTDSVHGLRAFAKTVPQPVRAWLEQLSEQSWQIMVLQARQHAHGEWQATVWPHWRTIANRYPLDESASDELLAEEFGEFFGPGGVLDGYFEQYVAPFVAERGDGRNRKIDGYGLDFSFDFLQQMQLGRQVQDDFFTSVNHSVNVPLRVRVQGMSPRFIEFALEQSGARFTYSHGPQLWQSLRAGLGQGPLRLSFESIDGGQQSASFEGYWAWFRWLDAAGIERHGDRYLAKLTAAQETPVLTLELQPQAADVVAWRERLRYLRLPESL